MFHAPARTTRFRDTATRNDATDMPTEAEVLREIGAVVVAMLAVALAAHLVAWALGAA
jgi:hypothetical protein